MCSDRENEKYHEKINICAYVPQDQFGGSCLGIGEDGRETRCSSGPKRCWHGWRCPRLVCGRFCRPNLWGPSHQLGNFACHIRCRGKHLLKSNILGFSAAGCNPGLVSTCCMTGHMASRVGLLEVTPPSTRLYSLPSCVNLCHVALPGASFDVDPRLWHFFS